VLFLAASLSLVVASARLVTRRSVDDALLAFAAMAACGIATDVALRQGTSTLPVEITRGDFAGLAVWLHGTAILTLLSVLSAGRESEDSPPSRQRHWLVLLLSADLAAVPPLPGFWLRGYLLLSLVSRQTASSITGEFEPHAGMLTLAILVAITWGAIIATALPTMFATDELASA
jgi:hypothetical protein